MTHAAQLTQECLSHLRTGDGARAEAAADALLGAAPGDQNGLFFKGMARFISADAAGALEFFDQLHTTTAAQPLVLNARGRALRQVGRLGESKSAFEAAVAAQPGLAEAHYHLAKTHADLGEFAAADAAYTRAAAFPTFKAAALGALAALRTSQGDAAGARDAVNAALAHDADHPAALSAWARLAIEAGDYEDVAKRLEAKLESTQWSAVNRAIAHGHIGEAREKLGRYEQAFSAFSAANATLRESTGPDFAIDGPGSSLHDMQTLRKSIDSVPADTWRSSPGPADDSPLFLVGFPRSGTTLLDQILSSHPNISVAEETDAFGRIWSGLDTTVAALPQKLTALSDADITRLRRRYSERLDANIPSPRRAIVIDKYPLLLQWAPVIRRVWPDARFIRALRDPRDAVLSAFKQRFEINPAMAAMLSLETAAAYYDAVMGGFCDFTDRVQCDVHSICYEDVVGAFRPAVESLLEFVGVEWSESVLDYRATAQSRRITTPSARQVVQPLYTSSIGAWRNYAAQMAGVRALLDPWAKRLGYDVD